MRAKNITPNDTDIPMAAFNADESPVSADGATGTLSRAAGDLTMTTGVAQALAIGSATGVVKVSGIVIVLNAGVSAHIVADTVALCIWLAQMRGSRPSKPLIRFPKSA